MQTGDMLRTLNAPSAVATLNSGTGQIRPDLKGRVLVNGVSAYIYAGIYLYVLVYAKPIIKLYGQQKCNAFCHV